MSLVLPRSAFPVFALVGLTTVCCQSSASQSAQIQWKINETTAQRLAAEAHYGSATGLEFFDYDSSSDGFFVFDGLTKPPAEGSFGFFAVNPWTGDVWALWGCHKLSTAALRQSQAAIRRRFTRAELKQYARLRRLKPVCIVED